MDFALTEEQQLLQDTARSLLSNECPPSLVRAHMEDRAVASALWDRHLRDWTELFDSPLVDQCLFAEQAGRVLLPGPFFATTALYLPLRRALGLDATTGSGTVALAGRSGEWLVNGDPVRTFVLEADLVDEVAFVVPGPAVAMVPARDLEPRLVETLDTSRLAFELDLPAALDATPVDADALEGVMQRATVLLASELVGTARSMLDASVAYAKERVQFDVPIGSFQALQHKMADMALVVERATAAVAYAAMTHDASDPQRHRATHVAKAAAGEAARRCAKDAIQIHGGIGYTWEHDLHLSIRRAYASEYLLGSTSWHHDRLAELLFI